MSLYKVISNYYVDLLDYLNVRYRKYNSNFDMYFQSMTSDHKKQFINKVATVFQRIEILRGAQKGFFKSQRRTNTSYIIILAFIIIISFIILALLFYFDLTEGELYTITRIIKSLIIYLIMYLIFFTIFLVLIVNIQENKRQIVAMSNESDLDINRLVKLFGVTPELTKLLVFIGFKNTETKEKYEPIFKDNTKLIDKYLIRPNTTKEEDKGGVKKKTIQPVSEIVSFNYDLFFSDYRIPLLNAVKLFYNSGEGYDVLRKEIISSSNIQMLKEFRRIMEYYYKLIKRKENPDLINDEKKIYETLDRFVVKDLEIVAKINQPPNVNAYINTTQKQSQQDPVSDLTKNLNDSEFVTEYNKLLLTYTFLIIYMTQIFLKKKSDDPTYDASLKMAMPHLIDISLLSENVDFHNFIKIEFTNHFNNELPNTMVLVSKASTLDSIYINTILQFKDLFDSIYQTTMMTIQGDYFFPFDPTYMNTAIRQFITKYASQKGFTIDGGYISTLIGKINTILIPKCYQTFNVRTDIEYKKAGIVSRIATNVKKFDINLMNNSKYILGKLEETGKFDSDSNSLVIEMLSAIDRDVAQKKLSEESTYKQESINYRFLQLDQFIAELDKITYNDLKTGLNYKFYSEILDRFYFSVSSSIYAKDRTSKDIYFTSEKRFKIAKITIIFTIFILLLGLIYHIISMNEEFKYYKIAKSERLSSNAVKALPAHEVKLLKKDYIDENVNIWIKSIVPVAAMFFFICLLVSFYKKAKAKFRFNKETIDANTAELRSSINDMKTLFEDLDTTISAGQRTQKILNIKQIGIDEKTSLYEKLKVIIDKFEKCNYVLQSQKNDLPFPYAEVITDGFMISVILIALVYVYGSINPLERVKDIKVLNTLKEKGEYMDSDEGYANDLLTKAACHDASIDSVMFTLKILFFMFIVMFLIFYSTKVLSSTSEFEYGIYNSSYFEESICLD